MALWQIIKPVKSMEPQYDDGDKFRPGDDGFSNAKVTKYAGKGNFNYIGTPNWEAPADPAPESL